MDSNIVYHVIYIIKNIMVKVTMDYIIQWLNDLDMEKLGRPATGVPKEFIKEYDKFRSGEYGGVSVVQFARLQGIASTFYKYAGILKEK